MMYGKYTGDEDWAWPDGIIKAALAEVAEGAFDNRLVSAFLVLCGMGDHLAVAYERSDGLTREVWVKSFLKEGDRFVKTETWNELSVFMSWLRKSRAFHSRNEEAGFGLWDIDLPKYGYVNGCGGMSFQCFEWFDDYIDDLVAEWRSNLGD